MKVSPASEEFEKLNVFAADCIYELVMNYPLDGMRSAYLEENKRKVYASDELLERFGYSAEEIREMRGGR